MSDFKMGDFSKPQNEHDLFLLKTFPNVPLSLMRDIWNIHSEMSEEQQQDFLDASIKKNWGVYDKKYNIEKPLVEYDTYENIVKNLNENERITCIDEENEKKGFKEIEKDDEKDDDIFSCVNDILDYDFIDDKIKIE